jgi:hypothetical protein
VRDLNLSHEKELLSRPTYHDQRVWLDSSILSGEKKDNQSGNHDIHSLEGKLLLHSHLASRLSFHYNQDSTFFQFLVTETQLRITNDLITCFMYEQNIPHD